MLETTILLLIIPDHKSNKSIITGKLFEYIASGKPIICLGPADGDAANIIKSVGAGETFAYDDKMPIENFLLQSLNNLHQPVKEEKIKYSRKELTGKIFEILKL
jgi:hypothetical protein